MRAVREAVAGRRYLSPPLSERAIEAYMKKAESAALDPYEMLTAREREVLHLVAEGHTSAEIADQLFIRSPDRVSCITTGLVVKIRGFFVLIA